MQYAVCRLVWVTACCLLFTANFASAQRNKDPKPHHEDLTVHRLSFPDVRDTVVKKLDEIKINEVIPATHTVNEKVNLVLDSIARFNKTKMFFDGFTIQIYSGLKKEDGMNAKKKIADELKELKSDLEYIQPKWRVKTGSYFTRLEAQRDLRRLKQIFPNAILVPEKIAIR